MTVLEGWGLTRNEEWSIISLYFGLPQSGVPDSRISLEVEEICLKNSKRFWLTK